MKLFISHTTPLILGNEEKPAPSIGGSSDMKNDYAEYERICRQIRQENAQLLDDFVALLRSQRLAPSTITKHLENVSFFINEFLLYEEAKRPSDGIGEIDAFLGDWFIRKAMWSTPRHIKANATSLYKFYAFLATSEKVTVAELAELKNTMSLHLPEWQARCERYNDVEIDDWRDMD